MALCQLIMSRRGGNFSKNVPALTTGQKRMHHLKSFWRITDSLYSRTNWEKPRRVRTSYNLTSPRERQRGTLGHSTNGCKSWHRHTQTLTPVLASSHHDIRIYNPEFNQATHTHLHHGFLNKPYQKCVCDLRKKWQSTQELPNLNCLLGLRLER